MFQKESCIAWKCLMVAFAFFNNKRVAEIFVWRVQISQESQYFAVVISRDRFAKAQIEIIFKTR